MAHALMRQHTPRVDGRLDVLNSLTSFLRFARSRGLFRGFFLSTFFRLSALSVGTRS